jgi:hypothetical protein
MSVKLPNAPVITTDDRWELGKLARGERCPQRSYFLGLQDEEMDDEEESLLEGMLHIVFNLKINV